MSLPKNKATKAQALEPQTKNYLLLAFFKTKNMTYVNKNHFIHSAKPFHTVFVVYSQWKYTYEITSNIFLSVKNSIKKGKTKRQKLQGPYKSNQLSPLSINSTPLIPLNNQKNMKYGM